MKYSDDQLIARVEAVASGFTYWQLGFYLIAVRSAADLPDAFDDKAYLFEVRHDGMPRFIVKTSCTTHPGVDVLKNYAAKYNPAGAAVLKSNQIVYESHAFGLHHGKYNAYRQVKPMAFFRDRDRDVKAEESGPQLTDIIMANVHRAHPDQTSEINHNWSAGCIVMNSPKAFNSFMNTMQARPLTVCILKEF